MAEAIGAGWRMRLRAALTRRRLSHAKVAAMMGVTPAAVGHWLSGRRQINVDELLTLCALCNIDAGAILFPSGESTEVLDQIRRLLAINVSAQPNHREFMRKLEQIPKPARGKKRTP